MAEKDYKRIKLELFNGIANLKFSIKDVDGKTFELMQRVDSLKSDDKVMALKVQIGVLWNNQEDVKKRLSQFCQLDANTDEEFEDLKVKIKEMEKEEENMNKKLNEMMKEIRKCETSNEDDYRGQKEGTSAPESKEWETLWFKVVQENRMDFLNEILTVCNRSGLSSGVAKERGNKTPSKKVADIEVCASVEEKEEDLPVLKEEVDDVKKCIEEWIKECEESDEEWEPLKAIKDFAIMNGSELSLILVNLMFVMLKRKELLKRFQEFTFSLRLLIEHENFKLINKMIDLMEMAQEEMREEVKKESSKGSSELNQNQEEKDSFDKFLVQILKEVQRLDFVFRNLHVLKKLRKLGLKQYEEYLKGMQVKIDELYESFSLIFGSEEVKKFHSRSRPVGEKITEWWFQFGDSLEN